MNAQNLLGLLLLAIVVLVSCAPPNHHHNRKGNKDHRAHQTLHVERVKVPEEIRQQFADHHAMTNKRFAHQLQALEHFKTSGRAGENVSLPLENFNDWGLLIANITVGSPPQTLRVFLSVWDQDLFVIGAGATEDGSSSSSSSSSSSTNEESVYPNDSSSASFIVEDASHENTYNASASITSSLLGQNFTNEWGNSGVVVSDVVNIAGLELKLNLGDLSVYYRFFEFIPVDGVLGLSPSPSINNISNLLEQLVGQLSEPTLVLINHRDYKAYVDGTEDTTERNELVLGTTANIAGCDSGFDFLPAGSVTSGPIDTFNVVSVSIAGSNTSVTLNGARPFYVSDSFGLKIISHELKALLVEASGAQLEDSGWYELPVANISQAKTVQLAVSGGGTINLQPNDYLLQYREIAYLNVYGFYNETDAGYEDWSIDLGQQYANNHCVAYNIVDKSIGVTNNVVVSPATIASDSASLAHANNYKKEGAANAKNAFALGGRRV